MNGARPVASHPDGWQQAHVDIGALAQRVTGLEGSLVAIGDQIRDLGHKLDIKPTNWWVVLASVGGIFAVVGTAIGMLLSPVNSNLDRHERDIGHIAGTAVNRSDYLRDRDETERWIGNVRDRLRADEDVAVPAREITRLDKEVDHLSDSYVTQRQLSELKDRFDERYKISTDEAKADVARIEGRIVTVDSQLVKRPEIEAQQKNLEERLTALSGRANTMQNQLDSFFPASKIIDEIWSSLREIRAATPGPVK